MEDYTNFKNGNNPYYLFVFSFALSLLTYGFGLTNYTLTIDNEIPIFADYGLDLGRWGQNLIRYHIFKGHLPYFSMLLSLFLFSLAAFRLSKIFQFKDISAYFFCALFVSFPQIAYQVVFGMMADIAGLGFLFSILCVELFFKAFEEKSPKKKFLLFASMVLLFVFTLSMYQAFVLVPPAVYLILFFQNSFNDSFNIIPEIKKVLTFALMLLISLILYYFSVKIFCPTSQDSSYLNSFIGESQDNQFLNFISIWLKNSVGGFYYGEKSFILVALASLFLFTRFAIERKNVLIRFVTLFGILIVPFLMSIIITNGYHPPRLYLTSSMVFAFVVVFALDYYKKSGHTFSKFFVLTVVLLNIYFVSNLFYSANKIYKHDVGVANKIDRIIETKYPTFSSSEKFVYFYGCFPYDYHQYRRLDKSEIFSGSIYSWDNGNNYRIINFFKESNVAEYNLIDTKERFSIVKDSIDKMPIYPSYESIKMFDNIIVVKLGNHKGTPLSFE